MINTNELWEAMGDLEEEDVPHVLTKLFTLYEERLSRLPDDEATQLFFQHLSQVMTQTKECNLNRR
ncbi:MAG: hypothetical protein KJ804_14885 [Proteobacteria bacterium]|nr:hypothetical protein [Pseudomonadota bacterium]MBU1059595.1 hypothetical protein [Pseudomonadota bacterium]